MESDDLSEDDALRRSKWNDCAGGQASDFVRVLDVRGDFGMITLL